MRREWLPILIEAPASADVARTEVPDLEARLSAARPDPRIAQQSYGADRIVYRVRLERPALLVENETFFPGWSARLEPAPGSAGPVRAVRVNGLFRGWPLPAGDYTMTAEYRFPGWTLLAGVTLLAWTVWITLAAAACRPSVGRLRPVRV